VYTTANDNRKMYHCFTDPGFNYIQVCEWVSVRVTVAISEKGLIDYCWVKWVAYHTFGLVASLVY